MKTIIATLFVLEIVTAFTQPSQRALAKYDGLTSMRMGYVPDGMTPEQYRKLKEKEQKEMSKKKFGAFGPQSFKSRSLQSFQKDLEKGKVGHLLPVFNAKEQVKAGKLREEDIPYMQRGGSWDNSDVKSAKKKKWSDDDKNYNANPSPVRMDWMGTVERRGPAAKAKTKQTPKQESKKKLFGMF